MKSGNYRITMPIRKHDIHIITSEEDGAQKSSATWVIILLIGFIISVGSSVTMFFSNKEKQLTQEDAKNPVEGEVEINFSPVAEKGPDTEKVQDAVQDAEKGPEAEKVQDAEKTGEK